MNIEGASHRIHVLQTLQHSLLFSLMNDTHKEDLFCYGILELTSKQASWRQQQRQFQKPFLKPVSFRKKTLKKQKLGLLWFHEKITGGIQTQARKILRLANGWLKVKDGYASTRVEQNTMFARIPSQVSFVNAMQLLHQLRSRVKKYTPREESQNLRLDNVLVPLEDGHCKLYSMPKLHQRQQQ